MALRAVHLVPHHSTDRHSAGFSIPEGHAAVRKPLFKLLVPTAVTGVDGVPVTGIPLVQNSRIEINLQHALRCLLRSGP